MKKVLKILSLVLSFSILLFSISISVSADTIYENNGIKYTIKNNNEVSVCGCVDGIDSLTIPTNINGRAVVEIAARAFFNNTSISELSLLRAKNLMYIGMFAFKGCTSIKGNINIPSTVIKVETGAFEDCSLLESVKFKSDLTDIPDQCFNNCSNLSSVSLNNKLKNIGSNAFANCQSLKSIIIPKSVSSISSVAFNGCSDLTIKCYRNSYAMQYAIDNGMNYETLDPLLGDVNGDEEITIMDATIIQKKSLGIATAEVVSNYDVVADVNRDGIVNIRDVTLIQMYVAGIITEF